MIEDSSVIRNRFLVKEKMIKDVMRVDSRSGLQFFSAVRREFEKEKHILAVKWQLVYKLAQVFQPGGSPMGRDDLIRAGAWLCGIVASQIDILEQLRAAGQKRSLVSMVQDPSSSLDIKDAVKEYLETKELVKKQVKESILKHRAAIIRTRATADVEYMVKSGQIPKPENPDALADLVRKKEDIILTEIVYTDLPKKTARMEDAVNRLVEWRSRIAAAPAGTLNSGQVDAEKKSLLVDFLEAVEEVKTKALANSTAGGIFSSPDALGLITNFKSNLNEQRLRGGHVHDFLNVLKTRGGDDLSVHQIDGSALSQAGCDRIDELMKEERNVYIEIRKWESTPGQLFEQMSAVVTFTDK